MASGARITNPRYRASSFPYNEDQSGVSTGDEITVKESRKNSGVSTHEISHSLGNEDTEDGGVLISKGASSSVSNDVIAETLAGVGIGYQTENRNGVGTMLNGSTNNGLENGEVISAKKYNRIINRMTRREERKNKNNVN